MRPRMFFFVFLFYYILNLHFIDLYMFVYMLELTICLNHIFAINNVYFNFIFNSRERCVYVRDFEYLLLVQCFFVFFI